jgi:hypothetical protein
MTAAAEAISDIERVRRNWRILPFIEQTPEICEEALIIHGHALQFVKVQTYELCKKAVENKVTAFEFVNEEFQTEELCMQAVTQCGYMLKYVKNQTYAICMAAIQNHGCALKFVKEQTLELCSTAVRHTELAMNYVKEEFKNKL